MKKKIGKKERIKSNKLNSYYKIGFFVSLIIIVALLIVVVWPNYFSTGTEKKQENGSKTDKNTYEVDLNINNIASQFQPVIDKLLLHEEMKNYNGRQATITILTESQLDSLKAKYPVIYSDANAGQYLFLYSDLLVIYDFEEDKIIKYFVVQDITIE